MRQIILDTETTGIKTSEGHRIVEIGAIELIDRKKTGRIFHHYINPERIIPEEVIAIHGITNEKVKNCKKFKEIADELITFINGAEIIAHNAPFDIEHINNELNKANKGTVWNVVKKITDSLALSKEINAKKGKHSLDALCEFYNVDKSKREFHGALLDSELLSEVYLKMTEGRTDLDVENDAEQKNFIRPPIKRIDVNSLNLKKVEANKEEELMHYDFMKNIYLKSSLKDKDEKILTINDKIENMHNNKKNNFTI